MQGAFPYDREQHESAILQWRAARLARLTADDGWLSLIGRFQLEEGANGAGSDAQCLIPLPADKTPACVGSFDCQGKAVHFTPAQGVSISLRSHSGLHLLIPGVAVSLQSDRDGKPDKLVLGTITMEVMERSDGMFVRVRDPESPTRKDFPGINCYPIDPKWRIEAQLERYEPNKRVALGYQAGSTEEYVSPGAAVFEIDGVRHQVDPVFDSNRSRLYLVFWDHTGHDTTYGAGRFLYAPLPIGDRVLLDFNQAFSPPCSFTPYAVCPLPPAQNRLSIRVEAGEKSAH